MEFRFNVNELFKQPIVEVPNNLLPAGFTGDRRQIWDTVGKVTEVVNAIGEASAGAQGLTKPITSAERLRNSEHKIYLLVDQSANSGNGAVTGMLKVGKKGLYVFDRDGQHYQVSPPCVLDFYIHESRQRHGLGKKLFEHMLQKETVEPVKMAIDRPSDKFLNFLNKHYSLNTPIKQMNNYVVFDGFFPKRQESIAPIETDTSGSPVKKQSANGLQSQNSPYGRYGAPRPPCSMGQIIHNQTSAVQKTPEPSGYANNQSAPVICNPGTNQYYSQNPVPNAIQSMPNMNNQAYQQQNSQNHGNAHQMQGDYRYNQQQYPQNAGATQESYQNANQVKSSAHSEQTISNVENAQTKPQQMPQYHNQMHQHQTGVPYQGNNMQMQYNAGHTPYSSPQLIQNSPQNVPQVTQKIVHGTVSPTPNQVPHNITAVPQNAASTQQQNNAQIQQNQLNNAQMQHYQNQMQHNAQLQQSSAAIQQSPVTHISPRDQTSPAQFTQQNQLSPAQQYAQQNQHTPPQFAQQNQLTPAQQYAQHNQLNPAQYAQHNQMTPAQFAQQNMRNIQQMQQNFMHASQMLVNQKSQPPSVQPSASQVNSQYSYSTPHQQTRYQPQQQVGSVQNIPKEVLIPSQTNNAGAPHQPNVNTNYYQHPISQVNTSVSKPTAAVPSTISNSGHIPHSGNIQSQPNFQNPNIQQQQHQYNTQKDVCHPLVNHPSHPSSNAQVASPTNASSVPNVPVTSYQNYSQHTPQTHSSGAIHNIQNTQSVAPSVNPGQGNIHVPSNYNTVAQNAQYTNPASMSHPNLQQQYPQSAANMAATAYSQPNIGNNEYQNAAKMNNPQAQYHNTYPEGVNINKSVSDKTVASSHQNNVTYKSDDTSPAAARQMSYAEKPYNANDYQTAVNAGKGSKVPAEHDNLEFGYPPQIRVGTTTPHILEDKVNSSPKLERPRSLSIQLSEDNTDEKQHENNIQSQVPQQFDDDDQLNILEKEIQKVTMSPHIINQPFGSDLNVTDNATGKKTPSHLTDQGFFDLKFYHNKLW